MGARERYFARHSGKDDKKETSEQKEQNKQNARQAYFRSHGIEAPKEDRIQTTSTGDRSAQLFQQQQELMDLRKPQRTPEQTDLLRLDRQAAAEQYAKIIQGKKDQAGYPAGPLINPVNGKTNYPMDLVKQAGGRNSAMNYPMSQVKPQGKQQTIQVTPCR